ncbi:MAG: SOS response-associated peptidase [Balneola sp.]
MCGRYHLSYKKRLEIDEFLAIVDRGDYRAPGKQGELEFGNYNVAPTSVMPVCRVNEEGKRVLDSMYWWYMKWLPKDGKPNYKYSTFNTRDDRILDSKMWGKDFKEKQIRCIVPMNGFYEFTGAKGSKSAHYFYPKSTNFWGAAGIYSKVSPNEGMSSFSIITTDPNSMVEKAHDRMPAFLHPSEFEDWLNPEHSAEYLLDMLKPYPVDDMETYIASDKVSNSRNNGPELLEPSTLFGSSSMNKNVG